VPQWALYYKHVVASATYDALKGNRAFDRMYRRLKDRDGTP